MGLATVLHMNGGHDETSYAKNSDFQRMVIGIANPIKEVAMTKLCKSMTQELGRRVAIADMGCSTGPNALLVSQGLVSIFERVRRDEAHLDGWLPEFHVFLNDLPGNDFNSIFQSLSRFEEKLKEELGLGFERCFVNGVPGSFYTRLFPGQSLHFVHSSSSLHWLSQVPKGVEWSKGKSEASVGVAYHEQFQTDFSTFLKCRSEELVAGGCMVLTMAARENETPRSLDCFSYYSYLPKVLLQMTTEGLIDEKKMDTFNLPFYAPSFDEIEDEVKKEGSFVIDQSQSLEVIEENGKAKEDDESRELEILGIIRSARSIYESYIQSHFGEGLSMDGLFKRYEGMVRESKWTRLVAITISLTKY